MKVEGPIRQAIVRLIEDVTGLGGVQIATYQKILRAILGLRKTRMDVNE